MERGEVGVKVADFWRVELLGGNFGQSDVSKLRTAVYSNAMTFRRSIHATWEQSIFFFQTRYNGEYRSQERGTKFFFSIMLGMNSAERDKFENIMRASLHRLQSFFSILH